MRGVDMNPLIGEKRSNSAAAIGGEGVEILNEVRTI
jgi:hypothetical protein